MGSQVNFPLASVVEKPPCYRWVVAGMKSSEGGEERREVGRGNNACSCLVPPGL